MAANDPAGSTSPAKSQFRYTVGLTRTVAENVAVYYDTVIEVPPGTAEETIATQAAETVTGHITPLTVDDLTLAGHELDAVVLDASSREQVPATLATIEFGEQIRYDHDGRQCEGVLFDVESEAADPPCLEGLVLARQIGGTAPEDQTVHRIPLGNIQADLEASDA